MACNTHALDQSVSVDGKDHNAPRMIMFNNNIIKFIYTCIMHNYLIAPEQLTI